MNKQIEAIGTYSRTIAKARDFFGNDIEQWREWLRKARTDARVLEESLFVDDPAMSAILGELSAFGVAADIILHSWSVDDGKMTDAEGVLRDAIEETGPIYEEAANVNA